MERKIIHCDADSFFASVEMRDNPALVGRPLAVGGRVDQRGVVATCNYEARKYGVHSAMPTSLALRLCPELVVVPTNMEKYRAASAQIRSIFSLYTDRIEPLSLDEAYLDVTGTAHYRGSATLVAEAIRATVRKEIGITVSAGIAPNKFLAKIASDWNKPDGQFTIRPQDVDAFVAALPIEKLFGVGAATAARLHALSIQNCLDLRALTLSELVLKFGKFGGRLYQLCRGNDDRPVKSNRVRKSISVERTYARDLHDLAACFGEFENLVDQLRRRVELADAQGEITGCFVKVRFNGFETTTAAGVASRAEPALFRQLLEEAWGRRQRPVRLLGLGVRLGPADNAFQLGLFPPTETAAG